MNFLFNLPVPALLAVTMAANFGGCVANRHYSKNISGGTGAYFLYSAVTALVSALLLFVLSGFHLQASLFTILLGIIFGIVTAISVIAVCWANASGPWSYTSVIVSLSMLIPTLVGAIWWERAIGVLTVVGIVLVVLCILFSVQKEEEKKAVSVKWLILSFVAMLATGLIGVLQQIHQRSQYKEELLVFLTVAFFTAAIISTVAFIISRESMKVPLFSQKLQTGKDRVLLALLMGGAGVAIMLNHIINLHLSGVMQSAVFYPLINGGNLVLVTLLSVFVYRERLTAKQWIGLCCGIVAVVCLCF